MWKKIKTVITVIFGAIASVFCILFMKKEKDEAERKAEELKSQTEDIIEWQKRRSEILRKNEEYKNKMHNNNDDGFNASVELLQNITRSGQERNQSN